MNKTQRKLDLLVNIPNCPRCGAKMKVTNATPKGTHIINQAAILNSKDGLICFQCHNIEIKRKWFDNQPFLYRWKKKINSFTGVFTAIRLIKIRINQFIHFKVKKKPATGKMPSWIKK